VKRLICVRFAPSWTAERRVPAAAATGHRSSSPPAARGPPRPDSRSGSSPPVASRWDKSPDADTSTW